MNRTGLKKNLHNCSERTGRANLVLRSNGLTVTRQCELLELNRASVYYKPVPKPEGQVAFEETLKAWMDKWNTEQPYLGTRGMKDKFLLSKGMIIGRDFIRRLMREMGLRAVYPHKNTSIANKAHKKFPYLLRGLEINKPNQVWAVDITYIRMGKSHMYLTAIIDWYSRFIVGWALSDTLETAPVLDAVKAAIAKHGKPEILNSDQGCQFTSENYAGYLAANGIRQSMDGKGRWVDNVIIERWFRSLKCDCIYINEFLSPRELRNGIERYIHIYNHERPHSSIEAYPAVAYAKGKAA